jgi:hypothetical protein
MKNVYPICHVSTSSMTMKNLSKIHRRKLQIVNKMLASMTSNQVATTTMITIKPSVNKDHMRVNKMLNYQQVQGLAKSSTKKSLCLITKKYSRTSAWANPQLRSIMNTHRTTKRLSNSAGARKKTNEISKS